MFYFKFITLNYYMINIALTYIFNKYCCINYNNLVNKF